MGKQGTGFAFLAGALAGITAGLLFAPKKGEELRKDLKIKSDELYDKVVTYDYSGQKEALTNKVDQFKNIISDIDTKKVKDVSLESLENIKDKAEDLVNSAKKESSRVKDEVKKAAKANETGNNKSTTADNKKANTKAESSNDEEDEDLFEEL